MPRVPINRNTRASTWAVTAFFDTDKTPSKQTREHQIQVATDKGWKVQGQVEKCPDTNNLHYQLMVKTPQIRAGALMDIFTSADVYPAQNKKALETYVHKEDTRVEELKPVKIPVQWKEFRDKFYDWLVQEQDVNSHSFMDEDRTRLWDRFVGLSWMEGIECDLIGVNPQYRSCILKYWDAGICLADLRRKTDRQTDTQEVSLPLYTQTNGIWTDSQLRGAPDSTRISSSSCDGRN